MEFMRILAKRAGLAESIKEFKLSGGTLRGHVGLISQVIRFAITGLLNTPDLFPNYPDIGEKLKLRKRLSLKRGDRYYPKNITSFRQKRKNLIFYRIKVLYSKYLTSKISYIKCILKVRYYRI